MLHTSVQLVAVLHQKLAADCHKIKKTERKEEEDVKEETMHADICCECIFLYFISPPPKKIFF